MTINVPKETFELCNFLVANIVPRSEHRKVRPELTLTSRLSVGVQAAFDAAAASGCRHADVKNIVLIPLMTSFRFDQLVEHVEPSKLPRKVFQPFTRYKLCTLAN